MANPEYHITDLLRDGEKDDSYSTRIVIAGMRELYKTGKYSALFIPLGTEPRKRTINAVHLAADFNGSDFGLLEFIPDRSMEIEEMYQRILRERLGSFDGLGEVTEEVIGRAPDVLKTEGLHVFGAFQLATTEQGENTAEIFFPNVFARLTGSNGLAATLSAAYVSLAQRRFQ